MECDRRVDDPEGRRQVVLGDRRVGYVGASFGVPEEDVEVESWVRIDLVDIDHDVAGSDPGKAFQGGPDIVSGSRFARDRDPWPWRGRCDRNQRGDLRSVGESEAATDRAIGVTLSKLQRVVLGPLKLDLFGSRAIAVGEVQIVVGTEDPGGVAPKVGHQGSNDELLTGADVCFVNEVVGVRVQVSAQGPVVVQRVELVLDFGEFTDPFAAVDRVDHQERIEGRECVVAVGIDKTDAGGRSLAACQRTRTSRVDLIDHHQRIEGGDFEVPVDIRRGKIIVKGSEVRGHQFAALKRLEPQHAAQKTLLGRLNVLTFPDSAILRSAHRNFHHMQ